jgi:hypothetical protein
MFFVVRIGLGFPWSRYFTLFENPFGIIQAANVEEAAEKLGVIRWNGWKKVSVQKGIRPELPRMATKWPKLFFAPFDTKAVDKNPSAYETSERRIRVIDIRPIEELRDKISKRVWQRY